MNFQKGLILKLGDLLSSFLVKNFMIICYIVNFSVARIREMLSEKNFDEDPCYHR